MTSKAANLTRAHFTFELRREHVIDACEPRDRSLCDLGATRERESKTFRLKYACSCSPACCWFWWALIPWSPDFRLVILSIGKCWTVLQLKEQPGLSMFTSTCKNQCKGLLQGNWLNICLQSLYASLRRGFVRHCSLGWLILLCIFEVASHIKLHTRWAYHAMNTSWYIMPKYSTFGVYTNFWKSLTDNGLGTVATVATALLSSSFWNSGLGSF